VNSDTLDPLNPGTRLVELDAEHPGFRDGAYRVRRDEIARLALNYRGGAVPDVPYSEQEQDVWREVWTRLAPMHAQRGCRELNMLQDALGLAREGIPQLEQLNRRLEPATGFRCEPVAGLVAARDFMLALGRGVFLSTQYMRHPSRPLYTPEPDIVHEAVGHAASLTDPAIAGVNRAFGAAAARANAEQMARLDRVYWHTLEFGMVLEEGQPKAFGAGLLSSAGELGQHPEWLPWDLDRAARKAYDPTVFQSSVFLAPSFDGLLQDLMGWLEGDGWA
jgi:phenylalanine-4-hydroxylase